MCKKNLPTRLSAYRNSLFFPILFFCLAVSSVTADPPGEVPTDAVFEEDLMTFSWTAVSGAAAYNVYKGNHPGAYDHECWIYQTELTSAVLDEEPQMIGEMLYFLVSAVNVDGEGILGFDSDSLPRANAYPCEDGDADGVADNLDNCPLISNPLQRDQDRNDVGDPCDPHTYHFENDAVGERPSEMIQLGGMDATFSVKDFSGDQGVSYDEAAPGVHDRFERLLAGMPHQNTTVYLDYETGGETCSMELWSEAAYGWNAGGGVLLQIDGSGELIFYDRYGQNLPSVAGAIAPSNGRLRLRLIKGMDNSSTLHLDSWNGSEFEPGYEIFNIDDDHRYRGLGTVLANYSGGRRGIRRVTILHEIPPDSLTLRKDPSWSSDWKVFQRDDLDQASIPLRFYYRLSEAGRLQARVVHSSSGGVLPDHDWTDHEILLDTTDGVPGSLDVTGVPTGGNYDVEVRLIRDSDEAVIGEAVLARIAVGDVYVAGGQSNMSGYSGNMIGAETPIDEVHLFHNDYTWKQASEPMDDGTDQVDLVSSESPLHTLMLRFSKEIYQQTGVPVGIIPGPLGGTNLHTQWQRNEADHDNRGTLYGSLLHRTLLQNYPVPVRGFLWYQGESDVGRGTELYKADLQTLISRYREDLDQPELFVGVVQLATYLYANFMDWLAIQEAQRQVAEEDPMTLLSAAIDLPRSDTIHLNVEGYKTIGARLAAEFREHLYSEPVDASARILEARSIDNGGAIELVYDGDIIGGGPSLYRVVDSSGERKIQSVSATGNVLNLNIQGRLKANALVTYGYSREPGAPWVKDSNGNAVACFQDIPVNP
jgi:hypothetical protein